MNLNFYGISSHKQCHIHWELDDTSSSLRLIYGKHVVIFFLLLDSVYAHKVWETESINLDVCDNI